LVVIWGTLDQRPEEKVFASWSHYQYFKNNAQSFEDVAANSWAFAGQTLIWRGGPYRVTAIPSTYNLFSLLGAKAMLGRTFTESDLTNGCTVVLAHEFWTNQLGASPEIFNTTLTLDGQSCSVVGIMSAEFEFFPKQTEAWTLISPSRRPGDDPANAVAIFARLKPGVTIGAAQAEAVQLHQEVIRTAPVGSFVRGIVPRVFNLQAEFTFLAGPNLRLSLLTLFAAVGMILLIACVNIASLLVSRDAERRKELALRAALGCGRPRIVRQLLVESLILAAAGASIGIAVASAGVSYFRAVSPIDLPPGNPVTVNWQVLVFTALLALSAGVLSGLIPAFSMSRIQLNDVLKGTGASIAQNWLNSRSGRVLIIAEVALSMVLLVGAGLLIESVHRLTASPLSFRTEQLSTANISLPAGEYRDIGRRSRFFSSLMTNLASLPEIEGAGKPGPTSEVGNVGTEQVSEDFMRVLGIPLLSGRLFDSGDHENAGQVVIVNQKFAEQYFPNEDPIGKQFKFGLPAGQSPWLTIVGLVGNVERGDFFSEMSYRIAPIAYRPITQMSGERISLVLRTRIDSNDLAAVVQREVNRLDARVPVHDFNTVEGIISNNFSQPRFRAVLLGTLSGIALLLAAVGLYGVLMQAVIQRTRELGIRMALGARRGHVLAVVIKQGLTLTLIGLVAGVVASLYLTRFLASMLFGVGTADTRTLLLTAAILLAVGFVSTYLPARRAARVDPILALKHE
jgi:predicted permease